ncbi:MAG: Y-family DNA polymerase [Muribaculaceae bacterium]|nr:Y-family DNA polymerase [Muribaculaceae bacterium]
MRALVDCNNFFVSCERVFAPQLNGLPVVVLSGNDGCIIARSNEAKALGIPMGAPVFKWRNIIESENIKCLSGNHALYLDMSRRIMTLLSEMVENLTVYSVDEAFFQIPEDYSENDLFLIAKRIEKCTGVPVSIGASKSQVLAKLASHIAKKERLKTTHSYILNDKSEVHCRLKNTPIGDIWGIGRKMNAALSEININTAYDFAMLPKKWVKDRFSITAERTWLGIHGIDCENAIPVDSQRQSITVSQTFSHPVRNYVELSEAISSFATSCSEKLRNEKKIATRIMIYIAGDRFNTSEAQYSNSATANISYPTSSTIELVEYATKLLKGIYRNEFAYKKAGVILTELIPASNLQLNLFNPTDTAKHSKLMSAVDKINNNCPNILKLAANGIDNEWRPRCANKSKEYTTSFKDILTINCNI